MKTLKLKVPGKIMLSGEYAVLYGENSLSCAVDRWMHLTMSDVAGKTPFVIQSDFWTNPLYFQTPQDLGEAAGEFAVQALYQAAQSYSLKAAELTITSEFDDKIGLGSSSALVAGVFRLVEKLSKLKGADYLVKAYEFQKNHQGFASGYDIITQSQGGIVFYQPSDPWPGDYRSLESGSHNTFKIFIHPFSGGAGAPTKKVGGSTISWLSESKERKTELCRLSRKLTKAFLTFFEEPSPRSLKLLFLANKGHREFFSFAPNVPKDLCKVLASIEGCDETWSFKLTGAGGEDAVLLLGEPDKISLPQSVLEEKHWFPLDLNISPCGMEFNYE